MKSSITIRKHILTVHPHSPPQLFSYNYKQVLLPSSFNWTPVSAAVFVLEACIHVDDKFKGGRQYALHPPTRTNHSILVLCSGTNHTLVWVAAKSSHTSHGARWDGPASACHPSRHEQEHEAEKPRGPFCLDGIVWTWLWAMTEWKMSFHGPDSTRSEADFPCYQRMSVKV